jgi:hypothetical protein
MRDQGVGVMDYEERKEIYMLEFPGEETVRMKEEKNKTHSIRNSPRT